MLISIHEAVHNIFFESLREIEDIIFDPHSVAHASGILYIVQGATGFLSFNPYILIMKQFHGSTNALITRFFCK